MEIAQQLLDIYTAALFRESFVRRMEPKKEWRDVMERVSEDRRQANIIWKLLKGLKEREAAAGADVENNESSQRKYRELLSSYSSHQSLRSLRASVVSSDRARAEPTTGPLAAESRLFKGALS